MAATLLLEHAAIAFSTLSDDYIQCFNLKIEQFQFQT